MVHMKALGVLFNFPHPKKWIHILRFPPKSHSAVVLSPQSPVSEWWLSQPNLQIFLDELQVFDMNFWRLPI
jgi:hypothetical protein